MERLLKVLRTQKNKETIIGIFIVTIFLLLFYIKPYPLELIDMKVYDLFFHLRGQKKTPKA